MYVFCGIIYFDISSMPPSNPQNLITYFAETDARNKRVKFGIKAKDRTRHVYVIGKTGMGKSTLLENMAVQDILNGEGLAFIDPHGKTADLLLEYVPEHRLNDVVYFAPFDIEHPISFNVLEKVDPDKRHLVVSGLMSTFKKIWQDAWSARMEYILTNTLLALLEFPGATLLGVNRMLSDKEFRKKVISHVTDPSVRSFWVEEFANYTERMAAEAVPAIQNKIGQFTNNSLIRNMIGQPESSFNIRDLMDRKKILIINLSKGRIGEANANLLGGMLITKIFLGALSRADIPDSEIQKLPNFYLFVDEFQNFANESFADILSEARKYKLNLTIAHQYIEQMEEEVRAAVFGNVGTMIVFRVGAFDAEVLEKEFAPQFTAEDIVNLGFAQIYLKLMIDGISSPPFSATTLGPIPHPEKSFMQEVIAASRKQFAAERAKVEERIADWMKPLEPTGGPGNGSAKKNGPLYSGPSKNFSQGHAGKASAAAHSSSSAASSAPAVSSPAASSVPSPIKSALPVSVPTAMPVSGAAEKPRPAAPTPPSAGMQTPSPTSAPAMTSETRPLPRRSFTPPAPPLKDEEDESPEGFMSLKDMLAAMAPTSVASTTTPSSSTASTPVSSAVKPVSSPLHNQIPTSPRTVSRTIPLRPPAKESAPLPQFSSPLVPVKPVYSTESLRQAIRKVAPNVAETSGASSSSAGPILANTPQARETAHPAEVPRDVLERTLEVPSSPKA
jgi:energy-coupling factor transporter ATP-binding protein EcfA2